MYLEEIPEAENYVAKELQCKSGCNTMYISQDMIRREILRVKDGENTLALPLLKELLIYGSKNSNVVILEGVMYADWYKPLFYGGKEI